MANYRGHSGRLFCTQWSMTDPDVIYTGADDFSVHAWRISQQEYIVPLKGQLVNFCRIFLPPANDVCEGYVFTHVWHSVQGGGRISACIAGGIPACLAAGLWGEGGIPACLVGFQAHTQGGS